MAPVMDIARMARALQVPGSDPRLWISLAIVTRVELDSAEGYFADVTLVPSMEDETARVGAPYAGSGFGEHIPVEVDDEVLVKAPSGDPDEGLVVTYRLHSPADLPPSEAVDNPTDHVLVEKAARDYRVVVSGGGRVRLGTVNTDHPCFQADDWNTAWSDREDAADDLDADWATLETAWDVFLKYLKTYINLTNAARNASPGAKDTWEANVDALTNAIATYKAERATYKTARGTFETDATDAQTTELRVD